MTICGDDHEHGVRDGDLRSSGFSLGILQGMNVLWDAVTLFVSGLHGALKGEQVDGMEASTGGLKMVQEVDGLHSGVKEPGVFEVADLSLFDDVNDELMGSSFSCFIETIVASNCFVDGFHLGT